MSRELIPPSQDEKQAARRFTLLAVLRFGGVVLAFLGLMLLGDRLTFIGGPTDVIVGGMLVLVGIFGVLILPSLIARKWKTPDEE